MALPRRPGLMLLLAMAAIAAGGCGGPGPQQTSATSSTTTPGADATAPAATGEELIVLCGSSFRPPMEKLLSMFEQETGIKALPSFEGSENFLPQVKLKAAGDIFVTHDPYMQYSEEADAVIRWTPVGYVAPVLVVQKGNPKQLQRMEDLAKPGVKVILPNPEFSTCGEMVFALLEKKGIKEDVLKNVGNAQFKSHSEIGNQMKLGYGDAAIMWNGVANGFQDVVDIVPCPYEYDSEIRVGVVGLSYTKYPEQVNKFLEFVDQHGAQVFREFGYVK